MTSHRRQSEPPTWDDETLEIRRRQAISDFIVERAAEGSARYREVFAKNVAAVEALFNVTRDLLDFGSGAALAEAPSLTRVARYLGGPPVSADDLDTLAEARIATRRRLDPELARKAATVVEAALDSERFPWLFDGPVRLPTTAEKQTAIRWTAGLQTVQEVQTSRRGESARRQESAVETLLVTSGFVKVSARPIDLLDSLTRGEFAVNPLLLAPSATFQSVCGTGACC